MKLILALVLGLMMVLLYGEFGVLRQVLLVLGVVPLATLGGLIALHLTGTTLNVASGVGFIALFGVAVMNGVIMVANLNRVREQGLELLDAVLMCACDRLLPVLMTTASVATVGMLPAALATGVGSATCSAASRPWWPAAWCRPPCSHCSYSHVLLRV